ncbi:MAG: B12-binding domain-containing radical SAM protein [Candidatus Riflebacteria bacterium]|nr:B12-binding domain-containing radical SAM protein [Candidatus Riflebacteria bacterium]
MSLKQINPDLLLIAPPLLWGQESRLDMKPPLNLLYLASWLNHRGFHAMILDVISAGAPLHEVLEYIAETRPRFIGVPFYQATRETAITLCKEVREKFPDIWVVAGGPLVTTFPESLMSCNEIDMCVCGEGELTLEELISSNLPSPRSEAADRSCLAGIRGLAYCDNGTPIFTPPRPPIWNLDHLPFIDFNLIDIQRYFAYHDSINMSSWLFLTTSRGCYARCTFCATPVLWPGGLRRQSVPRLMAEIAHQRMLFPQSQFGFMDDSFFSDKMWLNDFFDGIVHMNVRYCCIGRADHLMPDDVRRLADTGCIYVALGIETGNQARQKTLKKYLDLDKVRTSVALLAEHNIFCKCFFMLGFPDETPEEMVETINFAVELKRLGMGECNFFPVSIYPGTELAAQASKRTYTSVIYQKSDSNHSRISESGKDEDIGEAKLMRYANIPGNDVNEYFTTSQLLDIVKLAYHKVDSGQDIALPELPKVSKLHV